MVAPSAFDLLTLTDSEQQIMRSLMRQASMTMAQIAEQNGLQQEEVEKTLERLVSESRVVEQLRDGQRLFSVRLQTMRQRVQNMPSSITDLWNPPLEDLFSENRLTKSLPEAIRTEFEKLGHQRTLSPDELFAWQGKSVQSIGLVRSGLLNKVHLQGGKRAERVGYVRRGDWIGLSEALGEYESKDTYKAITECQLVTWPVADFLSFLQGTPEFSFVINRFLSRQLHDSYEQFGNSKVWAVENLEAKAGASLVAMQLATQAIKQSEQKVVLWQVADDPVVRAELNAHSPSETTYGTNWQTSAGFELFVASPQTDFPAPVYLDMLLKHLQQEYQWVVCNIGRNQHIWTKHLRGQADTLITITKLASNLDHCAAHWKQLQSFLTPTQKRVAVLNGSEATDLGFHFIFPKPAQTQAYEMAAQELFRRLSLNHTIAIFVPSTLAVDQDVDNSTQVQSTLSFLGEKFGGATSSQADGVWNSEESGLVTEVVTIVRTFVSRHSLEQHLDEVVGFASKLKVDMQQEAVAIDVDNQLILI